MAPWQRLSGLARMGEACVDRHEFVQKGNWARISTDDRETRAQLCQPWETGQQGRDGGHAPVSILSKTSGQGIERKK